MSELIPADAGRAYELDRRHVFHSWSAQAKIDPMVVTKAAGSYLWDGEGNRLLDFTSQLVFTNLGHQHPRIVAAIQEQAASLCTIAPSHVNSARSEAARLITSHTPGGLDRIFFTNGGADANEHAIRMARLHTGRHKVLSTYRSYHGGTSLAINVTGDPRRWPNDTGTSGTVHFFGPFLYRSAFAATTEDEECTRALEHLQSVIELEGPDTIAAIVLESIPGTAGIMVPPPGYLRGVRDLCDRHGILYIADEVMSGFGRSGRWFAVEHDQVVPDLLTFAKGVNSGYVPLGGVAISEGVCATFAERPYPGGLTYSGHPLACAAAVATIRTMEDDRVVEHAAELGRTVFGPGLRELADRHEWIGDVRGTGAFWAVELVGDRTTREPLAPYGASSPVMDAILAACRRRGLLPFANFNRIHVVPPLTITPAEAKAGLSILDQSLAGVSMNNA
ncbi:aspartate aminotransferase family protein [Amycolatopsis pithecellobii]|uniref:Aminotransferase class III-fold pyridoxal phosphate-dependent enzyme n=1 Tax=Amycolatopsis pithecellobii TaxID=664692 RepID=A0A6N7YXG6_9PSEU|nr:aspartate aminotransferase family protein [Amycolatopsis pithecellobii]MTD53029.1 aminotransferase class III-fold pyridoxal phosphate-dependent enzyme [Amycolatopsis pithecellobii]